MAVSKRIRYEILRRDNKTCRYCHATDSPLTVDHVVPTALGGTDDPTNLVAACRDCNAGKTSTSPEAPLVAQVTDDAVRWAAAMKSASDAYLMQRKVARQQYEKFEDAWETCNDQYRYGRLRLPANWTESIDQWLKAGVPDVLITEGMEIAIRNHRIDNSEVWRYTCGVIWKRLTELQEAAKATFSANVATTEPCGHCVGCIDYAKEPDGDLHCYTYSDRSEDEGPDQCPICGESQCEAGQAYTAGMMDGYDAGFQYVYQPWFSSFERLQFMSLSAVVDQSSRYWAAH